MSYQAVTASIRNHVATLPDDIKDVRENTLLRTMLSEAFMHLSKAERDEVAEFAVLQVENAERQDAKRSIFNDGKAA